MDLRDDIAAAVDGWASHAFGETYLQERLHPKARGWLIDRIETMLRNNGVSSVGAAKPAPKAQKPAPAPAPVEASEGASKGQADEPATPTMDDLKAKVKGKRKGNQ